MTLLNLRDVHAGYGRVEALHGIDLSLDEGSIVALLGANGAGKTTLLRAISRAVRTTGQLLYAGIDISSHSTARVSRAGVGHVPQGRGTFNALTVEENLRLGMLARPKALRAESAADLDRIYATFPVLQEFRHRPAAALSGGQAQMLAIGRAVLARPRLLLVDEPSLGLAPLTTINLFDQFRQLREEWSLTILLAEQNAKLSLAVADRAVVLARGAIALDERADQLTLHDLQSSYLGTADDSAQPHDGDEATP
mgnify:CR=1 FL=1